MTIGKLMTTWASFDFNPKYQRQGNVWSPYKKGEFVDTLFMMYDVPKFYVHELDARSIHKYAVVDGKQRLNTIRDFYESRIPIAESTHLPERPGDYPQDVEKPRPGMMYKDLAPEWMEWFKAIELDFVVVKSEFPDDEIEDLFERLNNGAPLNAAELRNSKVGKMIELIRKISREDRFFVSPGLQSPRTSEYLSFSNTRYSYDELAAKIIYLHWVEFDLDKSISKKSLDAMVDKCAKVDDDEIESLESSAKKSLRRMEKIFGRRSEKSELLTKAMTHVYCAAIEEIYELYAHQDLDAKIKATFEGFEVRRKDETSTKDEETIDRNVARFNQHVQQNTGNAANMKPLVEILVSVFLDKNPDVLLRDKKRAFTQEERRVIWLRAKKMCQHPGCAKLLRLDEMHADHVKAHVNGGATDLANAQCLCSDHNLRKSDS